MLRVFAVFDSVHDLEDFYVTTDVKQTHIPWGLGCAVLSITRITNRVTVNDTIVMAFRMLRHVRLYHVIRLWTPLDYKDAMESEFHILPSSSWIQNALTSSPLGIFCVTMWEQPDDGKMLEAVLDTLAGHMHYGFTMATPGYHGHRYPDSLDDFDWADLRAPQFHLRPFDSLEAIFDTLQRRSVVRFAVRGHTVGYATTPDVLTVGIPVENDQLLSPLWWCYRPGETAILFSPEAGMQFVPYEIHRPYPAPTVHATDATLKMQSVLGCRWSPMFTDIMRLLTN